MDGWCWGMVYRWDLRHVAAGSSSRSSWWVVMPSPCSSAVATSAHGVTSCLVQQEARAPGWFGCAGVLPALP